MEPFKVDNKPLIKKNKLRLPIIIILIAICAVLAYLPSTENKWILYMSVVLLIFQTYNYYFERKRKYDFIEWKEDGIVFQNDKVISKLINYNTINDINIRLDTIEIATAQQTYIVKIHSFYKYEKRLEIKNKFEETKAIINK